MIIAIVGFFSQFDKTNNIVLERDQPDKDKVDYAGLIAILAVICSILVAFPVSFNPTRQQFTMLVLKKETFTRGENILMTSVFVGSTWLVSVIFPNIS